MTHFWGRKSPFVTEIIHKLQINFPQLPTDLMIYDITKGLMVSAFVYKLPSGVNHR